MADVAEAGMAVGKTGRIRWLRLIGLAAFIGMVVPFAGLVGCQSKLIYFPRPYGPHDVTDWQEERAGKIIDYRTTQGRQRAFLQGKLSKPRNLWVVCAGNGSLSLDWSKWLARHGSKEDAWLLVDFPGYGNCEGQPTPGRIRENLKTAVPLAWEALGEKGRPDPGRLRFFGHSLGAASVMTASSEFKIQKGVLLAPFTSTMDMAGHMLHLPLGWAVWHRFDNGARLEELAKRGPGKVVILHGTADTAIPLWMSRELAKDQPGVVKLVEVQDGDHNSIAETNAGGLEQAIREAGE